MVAIFLIYFFIVKPQAKAAKKQAEYEAEQAEKRDNKTQKGTTNTNANSTTTNSGISWTFTQAQIQRINYTAGSIRTGFNSPLTRHFTRVTIYEDIGGIGRNRWTDAEVGRLIQVWRLSNSRELLADARRQNWTAFMTNRANRNRMNAAANAFKARLDFVQRKYSI